MKIWKNKRVLQAVAVVLVAVVLGCEVRGDVDISRGAETMHDFSGTASCQVNGVVFNKYTTSWSVTQEAKANGYLKIVGTTGGCPAPLNYNQVGSVSWDNTRHAYKTGPDYLSDDITGFGNFGGTKTWGANMLKANFYNDFIVYHIKVSYSTCVVYYNNNGAAGSISGTSVTCNNSSPTDGVCTLSGKGSMNKAGYGFVGWGETATSYVDHGTVYQPGVQYNFSPWPSSKTVYAQWAKIHTITYDMNGATCSAPAASTGTSDPDGNANITLNSSTSFTWPGHRFAGWSENPTAVTADIAPGSTMTVDSDKTLYAVWAPLDEWRVTYAGETNGVTGSFPTDAGPYYNDGSTHTITVKPNSQTRPGYTFLGWSTTAGSTTADPAYAPGQTFNLTGDVTLYSVWKKNNYTITFDGNGHTTGTVPSAISADYGATETMPATDLKKPNFVFDGWSKTAGGACDYAVGDTITIGTDITGPTTLYAHWANAPAYDLSYDTNAGGDTVTGALPAKKSYSADGINNVMNVTNVVPVRAGYGFLGWSTTPNGSVSYAAGAPITLTADTTLYAQWKMGSYTLSYDFNGGSDTMVGTLPPTVTGDPTTSVTVDGQGTMARKYHKFMGWNDAANGSGTAYKAGDTMKLTSNVKLYAQWKDLRNTDPTTGKTGEATLYYNKNVTGAEIVNNMPSADGGHYDDKITDMATVSSWMPIRLGYEFKGWSEDPSATAASPNLLHGGDTLQVITDRTLYAIWEVKHNTLTYDANVPAGDANPVSGSFPTGDMGTVATPVNLDSAAGFSRNHYTFKEWNTQADGKGDGYAAGASFSLAADATLYAIWEEETYTITYEGGPGATGSAPANQSGKYGASFVAEQPGSLAVHGKSFVGWKDVDGNTYTPGTSYPFEKNLQLTAQWSTDIWTIHYDISSAEQGNAIADANVTLDAVVVLPAGADLKKSKFVFNGWNDKPDGMTGTAYAKGSNLTIEETTPKTLTLYASWKPATPYKVTYNKNGTNVNGTEPPEVTCYNDGLSETTVVPADSLIRKGYTFMGWSTSPAAGASVEYTAGATIDPVKAGSDIALYAVWSTDSFTLTYDSGNAAAVGTPPAVVKGNATSNITAAPQGGLCLAQHKFAGWNTEPDYSGDNLRPGDPIVLDEDKTLYAKWTPVPAMHVTYESDCLDPAVDATLPVDTNDYYDDGINSIATIDRMKPLRYGYDFLYWTTQPGGAGTRYEGGETVTITADLTLYAVWDMGNYELSYDPGESPTEVQGSMPASKFGNLNSSLSVDDSLTFNRPYHKFNGWNTAKDGSGTTYQPGDSISLGIDTVLYAQWTKTKYRVIYDLNSPSIANATGTVPGLETGTYQDKFRAALQGDIKCPKYKFLGWNTEPDGVGDTYTPGKEYSFGVFEDYGDEVTLYAMWESVPPFEVVYDKNSTAASGKAPVDEKLYTVDDGDNLVTVLGPGELKWKGYEFVCWSTKKNGSGTKYVAGSQFRIRAHTKLYAQWTPGTYTLTYDKNGDDAKGKVPASIRRSSQEDITVAGKGSLTRRNYKFLGWATKAGASSPTYKAGAKIRIVEDTKLYAVWCKLINVVTEETPGLVPGSAAALQQVSPGTKLSEIKLPQVKSGYEITGWVVNGETVTNPENYTITKDSQVQPIVKKKPEKKPDKKPEKKPEKKPDDKKPDGNNPSGGNSGGGVSSRNGNDTEGNYSVGDFSPASDNSGKKAASKGGERKNNSQSLNEEQPRFSGDMSTVGNVSVKNGKQPFFGSAYGDPWNCIIHWLVLLGIVLISLYSFIRHRVIRKKELIEDNFFLDSFIYLLILPLAAVAWLLQYCLWDLPLIVLWICVSFLGMYMGRRAFRKNLKDIENEMLALKEELNR